jgi:hypothetical protein
LRFDFGVLRFGSAIRFLLVQASGEAAQSRPSAVGGCGLGRSGRNGSSEPGTIRPTQRNERYGRLFILPDCLAEVEMPVVVDQEVTIFALRQLSGHGVRRGEYVFLVEIHLNLVGELLETAGTLERDLELQASAGEDTTLGTDEAQRAGDHAAVVEPGSRDGFIIDLEVTRTADVLL